MEDGYKENMRFLKKIGLDRERLAEIHGYTLRSWDNMPKTRRRLVAANVEVIKATAQYLIKAK